MTTERSEFLGEYAAVAGDVIARLSRGEQVDLNDVERARADLLCAASVHRDDPAIVEAVRAAGEWIALRIDEQD